MCVCLCVQKNIMHIHGPTIDTSHACIVRTREACLGVWQHVKKKHRARLADKPWAAAGRAHVRNDIHLLRRRVPISLYRAARSCRYSLLWPSNRRLQQPIRASGVRTNVHRHAVLLPRPLSRCVLGRHQLCDGVTRYFHSRYGHGCKKRPACKN